MTTSMPLAACVLLASFWTGGSVLANTSPTLALAPLGPAPQGAAATEASRINYNYVWARWANGNGSILDSGDGFNLEGAYEFGTNFHVYGDFDYVDFDTDIVELTRWSGAVGVHSPTTEAFSAYARVGFGAREFDGLPVTSNEGLFLSSGLRFLPVDRLELEVRYSFTGSEPKYDSWRFGATLQVSESIGLGAAYDLGDELDDDLETLYAGVRLSI
jgi:hypothetical protein